MSRDYKLYLEDIVAACVKIETYLAGLTFEEFNEDDLRMDAVIRNLEIIGEATKHLPDSLRRKYSVIEWRKIAGLRDILTHAYFSVDLNIVWDVVENKLPELHQYVVDILMDEK